MTSILQTCDLHVNGPIKRKGRELRALRTYLAFKEYRKKYERLSKEEKKKSKFRPEKPNIEDGIRDVLSLFDFGGDFLKEKFEEGQTRCFIETGCVPQTEGLGDFIEYSEKPGTRHNLELKLPMISDDIETFNTMENEATDFIQGLEAFYEYSSESDDAENDFIDD